MVQLIYLDKFLCFDLLIVCWRWTHSIESWNISFPIFQIGETQKRFSKIKGQTQQRVDMETTDGHDKMARIAIGRASLGPREPRAESSRCGMFRMHPEILRRHASNSWNDWSEMRLHCANGKLLHLEKLLNKLSLILHVYFINSFAALSQTHHAQRWGLLPAHETDNQ